MERCAERCESGGGHEAEKKTSDVAATRREEVDESPKSTCKSTKKSSLKEQYLNKWKRYQKSSSEKSTCQVGGGSTRGALVPKKNIDSPPSCLDLISLLAD